MKIVGNISVALTEDRQLSITDGDNLIYMDYKLINKFIKAIEDETAPHSKHAETAKRVFQHWLSVMGRGPTTKYTAKRRNKIIARLREGYTEQQLKDAINGCNSNPFNMGDNPTGLIYDDIELICRDGCKVEKYIQDLNRHVSATQQIRRSSVFENLSNRDWAIPQQITGIDEC